MIVGDICAVPMMDGKYGLMQVIRNPDPSKKKTGDYFIAILDFHLSSSELREFNFLSIYSKKILLGMPVFVTNAKADPLRWMPLVNMPLVNYDPPMFVMPGDSSNKSKTVIVDFSFKFYRYIDESELLNTRNYYVSSHVRVQPILHNLFIDKNHRPDLVQDFIYSTITEKDIMENPREYFPWLGFGSAWEGYLDKLESLKVLSIDFINNPHVKARHNS